MALPSDLNTRWFQAFTTDAGGFPALNVVLAGGTVAGPLLFPDGTAAAPSIGFTTNNGTTDQVGLWKSGANSITMGNGPTGTTSSILFRSNNSAIFGVGTASSNVSITTSGNLIFGVDNTNDIGASAATRPRDIYVGSKLVLGTAPASALAGSIFFTGVAFASLGTPSNGTVVYCTNCDPPTVVVNTCTSAGAATGALAVRVNGVWECIA